MQSNRQNDSFQKMFTLLKAERFHLAGSTLMEHSNEGIALIRQS